MDRPQRKHPRLKDYDYSLPGYYYVTIQTAQEGNILSEITQGEKPAVRITGSGRIAMDQLHQLPNIYSYVRIDKYVIMPTHIHAIIRLLEYTDQRVDRPDLPAIICAYKSFTTRMCNRMNSTPGKKLFQASFYEHVIRNEAVYQACWKYIDDNPAKWLLTRGHGE